MERRKFLKQTAAVTATTLVGFPEIIKAQSSEQDTADYGSFKTPYYDGDFYYSLGLNLFPSNKFKNKAKGGNVEFKFNQITSPTTEIKSEGTFLITKIKKKSSNNFEVFVEFQSLFSGTDFPKEFKEFSFKIYLDDANGKNSYVTLKSKKEKKKRKLEREEPKQGCFLTTACLESKNISQDCTEQSTLKKFFAKHYRELDRKERLIMKTYYQKAPALIERINQCKNSPEIYDYIYSNLLIKTVDLIDANKSNDAYSYYKSFSLELDSKIN
jgi:hypothetical protein